MPMNPGEEESIQKEALETKKLVDEMSEGAAKQIGAVLKMDLSKEQSESVSACVSTSILSFMMLHQMRMIMFQNGRLTKKLDLVEKTSSAQNSPA